MVKLDSSSLLFMLKMQPIYIVKCLYDKFKKMTFNNDKYLKMVYFLIFFWIFFGLGKKILIIFKLLTDNTLFDII